MKYKIGILHRKAAVALALLLCLAVVAVQPAYATGSTADVTDETFAVDVDISWGAMSFTYTPEYTQWNPETHAYDATVPAAWTATGNSITVTNVGATGIRADFSATVTESLTKGDAVTVAFKTAADAATGSTTLSLELAGASEETKPAGTVYFEFSGAISKAYTELATVTITIIAE